MRLSNQKVSILRIINNTVNDLIDFSLFFGLDKVNFCLNVSIVKFIWFFVSGMFSVYLCYCNYSYCASCSVHSLTHLLWFFSERHHLHVFRWTTVFCWWLLLGIASKRCLSETQRKLFPSWAVFCRNIVVVS